MQTILQKLPFWTDMTPREKETVQSKAMIRHYKKGALLHNSKTSCLGFVLVLHGNLRICMFSEEGREITLFRLNQGDPCMLSASCVIRQITFETQIMAETDCDLLIIPANVFRFLSEENIHVRCFLYELATERFSSVMWTLQQILFARFDTRLAAFLLEEYDKTKDPVIRMTHEQIARQVSSAREVVARMLKRFSADGLVTVKRGEITIRNPEALRKL